MPNRRGAKMAAYRDRTASQRLRNSRKARRVLKCKITAEIMVDCRVMKSRTWDKHDRMKTGATRAWTTRQFNRWLSDFAACAIGKDKIISAHWRCEHGRPNFTTLEGWLSGVNGRVMARRGVFER